MTTKNENKETKAIVNWEAELAREATQAVEQEKHTAVGNWFKNCSRRFENTKRLTTTG